MLSRLDHIQKNKLLLPLFVLGLLLCWFLAFDKTFEAVKLNRKLKEKSEKVNDISFNPAYVQQKLAALNLILKSYKVDEQWNDKLWMQSSAIAAKQNVSVDFTLERPPVEVDSTSVGRSQSLYFYGGFIQLVKLVDTLERSTGIGKISALQVKAPKTDVVGDRGKKCVLRLDFRGNLK
ncbi:hypothetical protein [Pedobacter hiemivivus]|uniref:Uncharacterized protein n=1 Tax=Pedobacter hiemivivus TaxID=2530454 RepID=A0A4V2MKC7_9SPHI|nr:hypothetical protein [Pedobacter hiemivivus]TCC97716.1 hypothetical protein EZ444_07315 [Pedobacter hiemivivus]